MVTMLGGMEFVTGTPMRLTAPPETVESSPLRLRCPQRPEVVAGQVVKRGDYLVRPGRESVSCYVSPITGTVRRVAAAEGPGGSSAVRGYDVTIEPAHPTVSTALETPPPRGRKLDAWFTAMRHIGPWNDRDGNVGLIAQLEAARNTQIDTLICVGLDEYPPFADRSSLLMSFPDDAVLGTLVLADLLGVENVSMLCSKIAPVLGRLRPCCKNYRLRLTAQHNTYPSADPTLVLHRHSRGKRRLTHGSNPVSQRAVIVTPWTAIRIGRWYTLRKFDLVRPVLIASAVPGAPLLLRYAFPGQPLATLDRELARVLREAPGRVIVGNPITGRGVVVTHRDKAIEGEAPYAAEPVTPEDLHLVSILDHVPAPHPTDCISCAWCAQVCPTGLQPIRLVEWATQRRNDERLLDHLPWCIDCGLCSHVCPSSLPLAQTIRVTVSEMGGGS
ncbi:MAG: hypothetical protein GC164_02505 [Phycisphaera sp.]|nr:hypothetical protein [Phycisphaera sp.]